MRCSRSFNVRTGFVWIALASQSTAQVGDIAGVHDPSIAEENGVFYLFSTGVGRGDMIPIRRSRDLHRWEFIGRVSESLPAWAAAFNPRDGNVWAPDISHFGGRFHLYYSVSSFGTNRSAIGLATNTTLDPASPEYEWVDQGKVIDSTPGVNNWNAIDPNLVIDTAGAPWLTFGSYWTGIKLRRIDPATGRLSSSDSTTYSLAERPGSTAIEAPFLFRHGGYHYLFVSFDQCCKGSESTYHLRVGRSTSVKGPYKDRQGCTMLDGDATLLLESHDNIRGPGHCSVIATLGRDWIVHHYYDANESGRAKLQIRPLVWASDGWPLAGEPLSRPPADPVASFPVGTWDHSVDFTLPDKIQLFSNGNLQDPNGPAHWSQNGFHVTLEWPSPDAPGGRWLDACILSSDGISYVGRNQVDTIVRGQRARVKLIRGDANADAVVDLSDAVFTLNYLFQGLVTSCPDALDANDDGAVDITDPIFTLGVLFSGGAVIPPPRPPGGYDVTADGLGC